MGYKVRLTGNYLGGDPPAEVNARLATLFGRDVARIEALMTSRAEVKHNTDEANARRFKEAIEAAGAECVVQAIDAPLDIDSESTPSVVAGKPPEEERVVFEIGPSARASIGSITLALAFVALGALTPFLVDQPIVPGLPFIPVAIGLAILAAVAVRIKSTHYKLTTERLFVRRGLIARQLQEEELYRIQDVAFHQGFWQRILDVGDVQVIGSDSTTPIALLRGIRYPESVKETLRSAYRNSRRREGVQVGERILES